jgi:DNA-directed RNA polymerase subunit K/omega
MRRRAGSGTDWRIQTIDRLTKRYGRYALVVGVARRAHDLKERIESALEPSDGGLINRAIREVSEGVVKLRQEQAEGASDEEG